MGDMARVSHHYEAAFEDYVRSQGWPYISVNEQRKALFAGNRIKSFDYLVYPNGGPAWLVEIKGRKFPYRLRGGRRYWENWVTRADLEDLSRWQNVFGDGFEARFVFAYLLTGVEGIAGLPAVHTFRGREYAFVSIPAADYHRHAYGRSPKWDTVAVSLRQCRSLIRPVVSN